MYIRIEKEEAAEILTLGGFSYYYVERFYRDWLKKHNGKNILHYGYGASRAICIVNDVTVRLGGIAKGLQ